MHTALIIAAQHMRILIALSPLHISALHTKSMGSANITSTRLHIIRLHRQFFTKITFIHLSFTTVKNLLCVYSKTTLSSKILHRMYNEKPFFVKHYEQTTHWSCHYTWFVYPHTVRFSHQCYQLIVSLVFCCYLWTVCNRLYT